LDDGEDASKGRRRRVYLALERMRRDNHLSRSREDKTRPTGAAAF
jgi:hypothetical protein